jgi:hypothetical protein
MALLQIVDGGLQIRRIAANMILIKQSLTADKGCLNGRVNNSVRRNVMQDLGLGALM